MRESLTTELPELHSTPWSTVQPLDPASQRVQDFLQAKPLQTRTSSSIELDLDTLLSQRYSGESENIIRPYSEECYRMFTSLKNTGCLLNSSITSVIKYEYFFHLFLFGVKKVEDLILNSEEHHK